MSTPRYIRLAIRACKPAKISNPVARFQRKTLSTSQSFRDASPIDIKAGFPQVPASTDDGQPQPLHQDAADASPKQNHTSAAKGEPQSGVLIELLEPSRSQEQTDVTVSQSDDKPGGGRAMDAYTNYEGRQLKVTYPPSMGRISKGQIKQLFSGFKVERIDGGKDFGLVLLKTIEDAQKAISTLSGRPLPAKLGGPSGSGRLRAEQRPEKQSREESKVDPLEQPEVQTQEQLTVQTREQPEAQPQKSSQTQPLEQLQPPKPDQLQALAPKLKTENPKTEKPTINKRKSAPTSSQADPAALPRIPLNVVAAYHKPLKIEPHHGVRVASLQLRSYSIRNLEFMCDFALRAAYFLELAASGPVPLPKKIERWTMPRSNFVHKKSQENFERITRRRAIQVFDGDKDVVQIWLAYLRKHQFYGVGMKADVWEWEAMDVAGSMDGQFQEVERELDQKLGMFGWNKQVAGERSLNEMMDTMGPGQQTGVSMQYLREHSRSQSRI